MDHLQKKNNIGNSSKRYTILTTAMLLVGTPKRLYKPRKNVKKFRKHKIKADIVAPRKNSSFWSVNADSFVTAPP